MCTSTKKFNVEPVKFYLYNIKKNVQNVNIYMYISMFIQKSNQVFWKHVKLYFFKNAENLYNENKLHINI